MNLGDIVAEAQSKVDAETEHFAGRLMELLDENVPAPRKEAFMAIFSSIMEGVGDRHLGRIAVFNEVHRRLHVENQQR